MRRAIPQLLLVCAAALAMAAPAVAQGDANRPAAAPIAPTPLAPTDPVPAPPAVATAPAGAASALADPAPNETNAQRTRTQPGNNAPFWRGVHDSGKAPGTVNNAAAGEAGMLIQPFAQYPGSRRVTAGEAWREVRNWWLIPYGGALILIMLLAIALYYWAKGPIRLHEPNTGRVIERFTYFERAAHWSNAIAFCVLAISGLVMAFGKFLLLPLIGGTLFGLLTYALKTLHNFAGPLFAVSLAIVFFTFVRSEMPRRDDLKWLAKGGGLFGGVEPPSHRFNAGEKILFWIGVLVLGVIVVASGLVLDKLLPGLEYARGDMQVAHIVHLTSSVLMMAVFIGHIYMGTIGMTGAYRAMKTGYVDESWAHAHHRLWYDDVKAGRIPVERSRPPPAGAGQPAA